MSCAFRFFFFVCHFFHSHFFFFLSQIQDYDIELLKGGRAIGKGDHATVYKAVCWEVSVFVCVFF